MAREKKLIKSMAKRARDFFQSLADLMKTYTKEKDKDKDDSNDASVQPLMKLSKSNRPKKYKKHDKKEKEKKSKKSEKDPNAPKKPLPAFLLFSNSKRKEMKEAGVTLPLKDRLLQIEGEWAKMPKADKDVFFVN